MESCKPNHSHCLHQDSSPRGPKCCWCGAYQHGEHASGSPVGPVQFVPTPVFYPNPYWPFGQRPMWGQYNLLCGMTNAEDTRFSSLPMGALSAGKTHGLMAGPSDH